MPSIEKKRVLPVIWEAIGRRNSCAMAFIVAGAFWFVTGAIYGLFSAIDLYAPDFFHNIPWLVFSRVRPVHVNTVLFGFVTTTLIGCGLYYMPALLRTPLWSERLCWLGFLGWNSVILSGPFTFAFGMSQGREYTEYLWVFDVILEVTVLLVLFNLIMTVLSRREQTLSVGVWYFVGAFLWTAGTYPIGNVMWHPSTGATSGILDSLFLWYWGHNLPGLLLTPLAVGPLFFVVPRITRTPIYSHTLSLIGFWSLVALYTHIGGHHLLQAPVPTWLKTMSVISSLGMMIPVFVVLTNIWLTARQKGGLLLHDPAGRFVLAGTLWYLVTCIQGPLQSLPSVQRVTHFNNWTIGHSHIAVLGFAGFIALGTMWHIVPLITGRRVYSAKLINLQFGLIMFGLGGFFTVLTAAGLVQGSSWDNGETVYRVLSTLPPYMWLRLLSGLFIIAGAFVGLSNLLATIYRGQPHDAPNVLEEPFLE